MSTQKVTDPLIEAISSSVLTGALPVIDGSALTGISGFVNTTNANDPAVNTNPATGVGTVWCNSTSGEVFICTDATTDSNIWTNAGEGTGNVRPYVHQGTQAGFMAGGYSYNDVIQKNSFASDGNATTHGSLNTTGSDYCGHSSSTHGYAGAGTANGGSGGPLGAAMTKFPFAGSGVTSTNVVTLSGQKALMTSNQTGTTGYLSGGLSTPAITGIEKYTFASEGASTGHGDLHYGHEFAAPSNSQSHGYSAGGYHGSYINNIQKFAFANNTTGSDVGDLSANIGQPAGHTSETHGYSSGGWISGNVTNIEKYQFSNDSVQGNVGNITVARNGCKGTSSTTHGYTHGGWTSGNANNVDKFSFSNESTANDVGDLVSNTHKQAACQY